MGQENRKIKKKHYLKKKHNNSFWIKPQVEKSTENDDKMSNSSTFIIKV
jgi:hypothetical protein